MNFELLKIPATGASYMITYQKGKSQARDQTYNKSIKPLQNRSRKRRKHS